MRHADAMTKAGVILGSSLVRPLPLYPQPPVLPPTSLLVFCSFSPNPSPSLSEPQNGVFSAPQCHFKAEFEDMSRRFYRLFPFEVEHRVFCSTFTSFEHFSPALKRALSASIKESTFFSHQHLSFSIKYR